MRTDLRGRGTKIQKNEDPEISRPRRTAQASQVVAGSERDVLRLKKLLAQAVGLPKNGTKKLSDVRFRTMLSRLDRVIGVRSGHGEQVTAKDYMQIAQRLADRRAPVREERIKGVARPGVSLATLRVGDFVHTQKGDVFEIMGTRKTGSKTLIHALQCNSTTLERGGSERAWDVKSGRPYYFDMFGIGRPIDDRKDRIRAVGPVKSSALADWMPNTWKRGRHKREVIRILDGWGRDGGAPASSAVEVIRKIGDRALLPALKRIAVGDGWWNEEAQRLVKRWEARDEKA